MLRTIKKLGLDFIDFRPNWKIVKKLMRESFIRKQIFAGTVIQEYILTQFV